MAIPRARKMLLASLMGAAALTTAAATLSAAQAAPQPEAPGTARAGIEAEMTSAVEDLNYPDADRILQEQKITLKRGDGHITLVGCEAPHDMMVKSRTAQKEFCFAVQGNRGFLTMELEDAYGIWTEDHPVQAKITADSKETVINAPKNDYTPFGEAGGARNRSVLVELRVAS
ncbi:hypothetical protein ACH4VR_14450 [Streptomyces sp. NPDC020883]|uniref:hypothetical protein n=1 Tax=Streptomyces sp. NPDC020883 TaxID=3365099 RepID=UPI0037B3E8C6